MKVYIIGFTIIAVAVYHLIGASECQEIKEAIAANEITLLQVKGEFTTNLFKESLIEFKQEQLDKGCI